MSSDKTDMEDMIRLLDANRALEAQVTRLMDDNDRLQSCLRAADATILELQAVVKAVKA